MTPMTISAHVVNGHLQHEESLADLEGQRVLATLTVVSTMRDNGAGAQPPTPEKAADEDFDPEPPTWLDVEKDLYFPVKVPRIPLGKVDIRVREGKPSIILPKELPDE
ncbi:MAG: hypothetical protein L0Y71_05660 [Gemmataceae bacterium]|nr:hypothetical protein [Gemmataceae bacterium]